MKHHFSPLFFFSCFLLTASFVRAQDLMYLKNTKSPIKVKIYEIKEDAITYRPWGDTAGLKLVLPWENMLKLELENGSVFKFKGNSMTDSTRYAYQHKNAIKFSLLSPVFSNLAFSYERALNPERSVELGISIIGPGIPSIRNSRGMYGRIGYKFISSPDWYVQKMKYAHILKGGYIKPELALGGFGVDVHHYVDITGYSGPSKPKIRERMTFGGLLVNFGKQWVFEDAFLFDMYFGFGYGFVIISREGSIRRAFEELETYQYAFIGGIQQFPLALTAGLKIGYVFGKQSKKTQHVKSK